MQIFFEALWAVVGGIALIVMLLGVVGAAEGEPYGLVGVIGAIVFIGSRVLVVLGSIEIQLKNLNGKIGREK